MKVALIHDHLAQDGGAEKVLRAFQEMYPDAPIFVVVYDQRQANPELKRENIRTSFVQHLPFGVTHYQWYLTLMPAAVQSYDLSEFDLVLSSSASFAKGVITSPRTLHVNYCHTPTRFLWSDAEEYLAELKQPFFIKWAVRIVLPFLRRWDYKAAQRPQVMIANSKMVQGRIHYFYHRESKLVYPPVDLDRFSISTNIGNYFLTGGRLVPYKRFDIVIDACNELKLPLKVFGDGPDRKRLESIAGPTVEFLGRVSDVERGKLYQNALAFVNAQEEDFGITAIESMASGRPVIAYAKGGALETVIDGVTGKFFYQQTGVDIAGALSRFRSRDFDPAKIRAHAQTFSHDRFLPEMQALIKEEWERWQKSETLIG